jgi:hypothetical protein
MHWQVLSIKFSERNAAMAVIANNDILEARLVCYLGPQLGINVYHYRAENLTPVVGDVTTADAAVLLSDAYADAYAECMTDVASFFGAGVRRLEPTVTLEDGWAGDERTGASPGTPLPTQMCGLIAFLTGLGGRMHRGRRYVPFPSLDHIDASGNPISTYLTPLAALAAIFTAGSTVTGVGGTTVDLVPVLKHADNTVDPITSAAVRNKWGTQRSRGGYGRPNTLPVWPS